MTATTQRIEDFAVRSQPSAVAALQALTAKRNAALAARLSKETP